MSIVRNRFTWKSYPKGSTKPLRLNAYWNVLSMIKFAGLGVAMANAQPPVKSNADQITAFTNDEDGVAHFIHDLLNSNTHQNIHEIG